jgi:hypothetical protein
MEARRATCRRSPRLAPGKPAHLLHVTAPVSPRTSTAVQPSSAMSFASTFRHGVCSAAPPARRGPPAWWCARRRRRRSGRGDGPAAGARDSCPWRWLPHGKPVGGIQKKIGGVTRLDEGYLSDGRRVWIIYCVLQNGEPGGALSPSTLIKPAKNYLDPNADLDSNMLWAILYGVQPNGSLGRINCSLTLQRETG